MSAWLQWILGACALTITIASMLVAYGRREEHDAGMIRLLNEKIEAQGEEIDRLRTWRHQAANFEHAMQLLMDFNERLKRLESRVFNGGPR